MSQDDAVDFIIGKGLCAVLKDAELALSVIFELCRYPAGCRAVARDDEVYGLVQALCGVERAFPVALWVQQRGRSEWFARDAPSDNVMMPACVEQAAVDCLGRCLSGLRRHEDAPLAFAAATKLLSPPSLSAPTLDGAVGAGVLGARRDATAGLEPTLEAIEMDAGAIPASRSRCWQSPRRSSAQTFWRSSTASQYRCFLRGPRRIQWTVSLERFAKITRAWPASATFATSQQLCRATV